MKTNSFLFNKDSNQSNLDSKNTLVFAFFNRKNPENASLVKSQFPLSTVVGCSSSGSILSDSIHNQETVVSVLKLEKSTFKKLTYECDSPEQGFEIGQQIGSELMGPKIKGILLITDGLLVNGSKLTSGINSVLKEKIYIGGGMAGDGVNFEKTLVLDEDQICSKKIIAIAFYGDDLDFLSCYKGGWQNFGATRKVTKSVNNIVYELDNKPALELYKEFLGKDLSAKLPGAALYYPLSLTNENGIEVIRSILSTSETDSSLIFAGDLPEGSLVRLMHSTNDTLINASLNTSVQISDKFDNDKKLFVLVVSCVGRRVVLDEYTEDELTQIKNTLPNAEISGFYSYGEFSVGVEKNCVLHNQTLTLIGIQEK